MRFYKIVITDPADGKVFVPNVGGKPGFTKQDKSQFPWTYCSLNDGADVYRIGGTNPAAQRVELDIAVGLMHQPMQNAFVRVHGISLAEMSQAVNLNGMNIAVYAGMARGLPLANPAQARLLVSGQISPAFGNWVNTEQSISFTIIVGGSSPSANQTSANPNTAQSTPLPATNSTPGNLVWQWKYGQRFTDAVTATLSVAYPRYQIVGAVLPALAWTSQSADTGFFATLQQFAQYLNDLSLKVIGASIPDPTKYPGVSMTLQSNQIVIGDGSTITTPKVIEYVDLIGQPTQSGLGTIQATCRLRGDINAGDYVKLPNVPGTSQVGLGVVGAKSGSQFFNVQPNANGYSNQKSGSIFTGTFQVTSVRHVGNSREPDALNWVTTIDAYLAVTQGDAAAAPVDSLPVLYAGSNRFGFYLPN